MSQHEAVAESPAIGVADEKTGRTAPDAGGAPARGKVDEDALKSHMKKAAEDGKLPKYGVPDRYLLVEAIPKTSVGKLDKKAMRQQYR
jgi:fatty-acyl-CoA synthase